MAGEGTISQGLGVLPALWVSRLCASTQGWGVPSLPVGRAVVCPLPPQVLTIWDSGVGWTNEWGAVCCSGALAGTTSESL